ENGEVGGNAVVLLSSAAPHTESGDNFIKNQKSIVAGALLAQDCQKIGSRKIQPGIGWDRLHDEGGNGIFVIGESFAHQIGVIKWQGDRQASESLRHASAVRLPVSERAAAGFHQQRISMAVITAVELNNLIPPRKPAG